jgi:hypothetical protein
MMRSLTWWIEWPVGPVRVGVAFLVAVATVAAAVRFPGVVRDLGTDATRNSALSYTDREIAGGNDVVEDQRVAYEARARIPLEETYHVAVGGRFQPASPLTVQYVASYFLYFLMPRRPAEDARWVICYGCDLTAYGAGADVVWTNGKGISIVRRRA